MTSPDKLESRRPQTGAKAKERFVVVGGGLVGMATAQELKRLAPWASVRVLEKESEVGQHQSTHNSGVLHAGLYYKPGSFKARLAVEGIRRMIDFCARHGVAHEVCGKLVVAAAPDELPRLRTLLERGQLNGLRGLRWLEGDALREIEPHAAGVAAVHVPGEGIVDYRAVCSVLERELRGAGVAIDKGAGLLRARRSASGWRLSTTSNEVEADFVINCAGLYSDRVAECMGEKRGTRIVPFRGEYYVLRKSATHLVNNLIYPVPDPSFPFLGVHFTRMISGGVEAGPNAVLAFAREGYSKRDVRLKELADAVFYRGLWNFVRAHGRMAWEEVVRSFSKQRFCASLQRLVPAVQTEDLLAGGAGVRAQAMQPDGTLVQDFEFVESAGALHVLNAPSPGATACFAIGEHVAGKALEAAIR